ncbi:helix-turn-helix domain-containing protein [Actinomycetospora sp. OC33-EN08]|uniref:Helix-turn-helix domain-containing protein n=1 Tax=Actinomycetospora aurantiaca TaxID=3129233 RepID=A0ABU8MLJ8_9PSEU
MTSARPGGLAGFLRAARARARAPADVGERPRRVPGLRREELARAAGVSVEYVTRLEQGRSRNASPEVIDALARALDLGEVEYLHLHDLAFPRRGRRDRRPARRHVHPAALDLLETFDAVSRPALVLGRRLDVLAWNDLASRLAAVDFATVSARARNAARMVLLTPGTDERDDLADRVAALLRFESGRHPDDPLLAELVVELAAGSGAFRRAWARHRVRRHGSGEHTIVHPVVGEVTVTYQALRVEGAPDQTLYVLRAEPHSPSAAALGRLQELRGT